MNSVECRPVGSSDVARIDIRAFHGRRSAARIGDSSGARPNRSPCTVAEGDGRSSWRGETASGLRRNAPTIEPADVPTTRSATLASYPRSVSARSTPRWKASPVSPPAPRTRPILLTETCFPVAVTRIHRSTHSGQVEVRALGPVEVVVDGSPVDLGPPKQRALFALLLAGADRVVSVDALTERLWAGEPPPRASASLQAYVSNLRRILEPNRSAGTTATVLLTRAPGYLLRTTEMFVDVREFADQVARADTKLATGDAAGALTDLDDALALWRGEPYADVRDADWADLEITRLDELRLSAVEQRARALLALGRPQVAVADLEVQVATHPLRERSWELLAVALYRCGRQADALHALRSARDRLADELGIDPGPDLQQLEVAILRQDPQLHPAPPAPAVVAASTSRGSANDAPFVGRTEALAALAEAGDSARAGRTTIVLVEGEQGIGKTRLVERALESAGMPTAWGRCPQHEVAPPLWPWEQVLAGLADDMTSLVGDQPSLTEYDAMGARIRLYDAVARRLADAGPLAVVLDDLHWADTASLHLLVHLADALPDAALLVVATYRRHEADHLTDVLAALARAGARRISLDGLDAEDVRSLVTMVSADPGAERAADLAQRTGGNPFFVGELARLPDNAVPAHVRDVVLQRVGRLPEKTAALLATAAVAGLEFDAHVVADVAGIGLDATVDLLDAGLASGLVNESHSLGAYRFAHALVRDALLSQHSRLRIARLHEQYGEVTARRYEGDPARAGEVARHWLAAAGLGSGQAGRAVEQAVAAAQAAESRLAADDAAGFWEEAIAAAELAGQDDVFDLLLGLTSARHRAGHIADALTLLDSTLDAADDDAARLAIAAVAIIGNSLWYPWGYGERPERLLTALETAVAQTTGDSADHALLLGCYATVLCHVGDTDRATAVSAESVAIARRLGDDALLARALHLRLLATYGVDALKAAYDAATELAAMPSAPAELVVSARIVAGSCRLHHGDVAGTLDELDAVDEVIAQLRSPVLRAQSVAMRVGILSVLGRHDESAEIGEELHRTHLTTGATPYYTAWLTNRLDLCWQRGRLAGLSEELLAAADSTGVVGYLPGAALALIAEGHDDEARDVLRRAPLPSRDYTWLAAAASRMAAALELNETAIVAETRALLEPFRHYLAVAGSGTAIVGSVAGWLGEAALALGDTEAAESLLREAVTVLDRCGAQFWAARAHQALAKCSPSERSEAARVT